MVHAHTSPAIGNALRAGVRSIEHGSILDEPTAAEMARRGAYLVPTIAILDPPALSGRARPSMTASEQAKADRIATASRESMRLASSIGVAIASGSDFIGHDQRGRAWEIVAKARDLGPMGALVAATRTNAELLRIADRVGTIEVGKDADLVLVKGDPLSRIETIAEAGSMAAVIRGGIVVDASVFDAPRGPS
jgi:imidazolonepropionase-like amidohydrolase